MKSNPSSPFEDLSKNFKNTKQINELLHELEHILSGKSQSMENMSENLKNQLDAIAYNLAESEQKKIILENLNKKLEKHIDMMSKEKLSRTEDEITKNELLQQKEIMLGIEHRHKKKITMLYYVIATLAIVFVVGMFTSYDLANSQIISNYKIIPDQSITSIYTIQNLRGDTIDTWLLWQIPSDRVLHINIVKNQYLTNERFEIIKSVILDDTVLEISDLELHKGPKDNYSVYYLGWREALKTASQSSTKFTIPVKFEIISEPQTNVGDIVITLTSLSSGDGVSGFTKNIADASQNQILKSYVTIYDVDQISNVSLETIVRHELGHAFGLAHTTAPEDLMAPEITTSYPYISPCTVSGLISLYDGNKKSAVVCDI